jgi:hypothetical protein
LQAAPPRQAPRTAAPDKAAAGAFRSLLHDHARYAIALALTPKRSAPADGDTADHHYIPV